MNENSRKVFTTLGGSVVKVLNGVTIAIVVALIPNAILATLLKFLYINKGIVVAGTLLSLAFVFQFFTPIMAGFVTGLQFKLNPLQCACIGGATFLASGALKSAPMVATANQTPQLIYELSGIGDIVNVILIAGIAVIAVKLISPHLGSLNLILLPIIVGLGIGYVGTITLPYVSKVSALIGRIINSFTTMQPLIATILIAISFSILIITPISTVAIGLAIGLTGGAAAAAGMGVAATATFLIFATAHANKPGVPIAIGLGGMKMMMPNFISHPIMGIPIAITAAITAIPVSLVGMNGTPKSAGFGLVGLISPLASIEGTSIGIIGMILYWIAIPCALSFIIEYLCRRIIKLYDKNIFIFTSTN